MQYSEDAITVLRMLKPKSTRVFVVGRGQFILRTKVKCQQEVRTPRILIDTGAQPNLVRKGLFPSSFFKESPHPLSLTAANGGPVSGGKKQIILTLSFLNQTSGELVAFRGNFYEADIPLDIILSHGWMGKNKLVPFPEFSELGLRKGDQIQMLQPIPPQEKSLSHNSFKISSRVEQQFFDYVSAETE